MTTEQARVLADALRDALTDLDEDDRSPRSFAYPSLGAPLVSVERDSAGRESIALLATDTEEAEFSCVA